MEKIKIVVLESPYNSWNEPMAVKFFTDLVGVKLRAYGREYPHGVLPVDGADFISTHIAVCRIEDDGSYSPILCNRWTSLKKCRLHYLNFPGLSLLQQANAPEHIRALEEIICKVDERNADLLYSGGLSIDPLARTKNKEKLKEESLFFRELLTLMYVNYQIETNCSEVIAGGTMRFKVDRLTTEMGHKPLMIDNVELEPIQVKHLAGEAVKVMHLKEFSFETLRIAKKWQYLWDERFIINERDFGDLKKTG